MGIYIRLRTRPVLHRAWAQVRSSGLASDSESTKRQVLQFDANWLNGLEKIRHQLKEETFAFVGERGITPPKGKGKTSVRPIVIAPIANRIVRRAILEVLQGYGDEALSSRQRWGGVPAIREIMATPTSIGGIPERGVPHGLAIITKAVGAGNHWFVRSTIHGGTEEVVGEGRQGCQRRCARNEAFTRRESSQQPPSLLSIVGANEQDRLGLVSVI